MLGISALKESDRRMDIFESTLGLHSERFRLTWLAETMEQVFMFFVSVSISASVSLSLGLYVSVSHQNKTKDISHIKLGPYEQTCLSAINSIKILYPKKSTF